MNQQLKTVKSLKSYENDNNMIDDEEDADKNQIDNEEENK